VKQTIKYFIVIACFMHHSLIAQNSWIVLGNCADLSLKISLPGTFFLRSDPTFRKTYLSLEIINRSSEPIEITPPLDINERIDLVNVWPVNRAYLAYKISLFDSLTGFSGDLNNDQIYADIGSRIIDAEPTRIVSIKNGEKFVEKRRFFNELNPFKPGKYQLQVLLAVKTKENTVVTFISNTTDFEIK
jgi:hypothetical protein